MRHEQMAKDAAQTGNAFYDHEPGRWMTSPQHKDYQDWAKAAVEMPEFWRANYLSTDYRIAVNYVKTNSCRAVATNALNGNMWHDFASDSYRSLPAIGDIRFYNPYGARNRRIRTATGTMKPIRRATRRPGVPPEAVAVRVSIACRRWSRSGLRRRFCTTTASANTTAIPTSRDGSKPSTTPFESCFGRKSGRRPQAMG